MISKYYVGKSKKIHYVVSLIPLILGLIPITLITVEGRPIVFGRLSIGLIEALIITLITSSITASLMLLPKFMLSSQIDKLTLRLPHIILKLRTLIAAGEPPLKAFEEVVRTSRLLILDLIFKEIVLGDTPEEAVEDVRRMVGSHPSLDVLKRVMSAIEMGGESTALFLKDEFEGLMAEKDSELRKAMENLSVIVELYMSMGVFAPVIGIIMLSSLAILGGIDVTPLISALIFIAIPLFSVFSAIMAKRYVERALL